MRPHSRAMRRSIVILCIGVVLVTALLSAASTLVCATLVALALLVTPATGGLRIRWNHAARAQRRSLLCVALLRAPPALFS